MFKVFQGPVNIAGQMTVLCEGLQKFGWQALGYNWVQSYLNYKGMVVQSDAYEMMRYLEPCYRFSDIIHYHNASSFMTDFRDLQFIQSLGKKAVMHHWGNDVRNINAANARLPYPLPPGYYSTEQIERNLEKIAKHVRTAIIQDYELFEHIEPYYDTIFSLPLAIDTKKILPHYPSPEKVRPLLVHAPTDVKFKGTSHIERALDSLRKEYDFEYKRIEKMSHAEAMRWYAQADVVIDQVLCGTYGLLSVEAMAMGKPVVTYIRDDLRKHFPKDLPIVSAHPDHVADALRPLLDSGTLRYKIGRRGRVYAESFHDVGVVIPELIRIYHRL